MNNIVIAALVFVLGFSIAAIIALGITADWQWLLIIPTAFVLFYAYQHLSKIQHRGSDLIGSKGGHAFRGGGLDESDDEE